MAPTPKNRPKHIVVFIQENKTTDFYFPTLAEWGADVVNSGKLLSDAPDFDQPHDRNSWVHYKMGDYPAARFQVDNDTVIPFFGSRRSLPSATIISASAPIPRPDTCWRSAGRRRRCGTPPRLRPRRSGTSRRSSSTSSGPVSPGAHS